MTTQRKAKPHKPSHAEMLARDAERLNQTAAYVDGIARKHTRPIGEAACDECEYQQQPVPPAQHTPGPDVVYERLDSWLRCYPVVGREDERKALTVAVPQLAQAHAAMLEALEQVDQFAAYDDNTSADDLRGNLDTVRRVAAAALRLARGE